MNEKLIWPNKGKENKIKLLALRAYTLLCLNIVQLINDNYPIWGGKHIEEKKKRYCTDTFISLLFLF